MLRAHKFPRFNLKVFAYVYDSMIDFPTSNFMYNTISTVNFFRNFHRLIKVKIHLYHSHITGKILGYSHDFCNWTVRGNKSAFAMIAHNIFCFDLFFFIKGYWATAWDTKDLNIDGTNLTDINYRNIDGEVKFRHSEILPKTFRWISLNFVSGWKKLCKKLAIQFFCGHYYFSEIWRCLGKSQKFKILDIITKGKRIMPFEKIVGMNSMFLVPENEVFFEKSDL